MTEHDKFLGMDRRITRCVILQGATLGIAGLAIGCTTSPPRLDTDAGNLACPPGKFGLRGQDVASTMLGHRVRDGIYTELPENGCFPSFERDHN